MKQVVVLSSFLFAVSITANAQLYFPPNNSSLWDTVSPTNLGWCPNKIQGFYNFLDSNNTKAFILLKDGKIVLEQYFNGHSAASTWYWASAGKTLTAFLIGVAQQENYLNITDTTSTYLGQGWTTCTPAQEAKITIWNQLTMTSGLDDGVADPYCTASSCLQYLSEAGTRWAYHNAPYTLLDRVLEEATGQNLNFYTAQKVKNPTGMDGLYLQQGYNNVFFSTARSMARFGLLILNGGTWDGNPILTDFNYFNQMVNTSQNLNQSYGYLWWLNGKNSYMVPQTQFTFSGSMTPNAPNDMIAALGKNGQFINVVPSQNMVWIRMGEAPDNSLVPFTFNDDIWERINDLNCDPLSIETPLTSEFMNFTALPNPAENVVYLRSAKEVATPIRYSMLNIVGEILEQGELSGNSYRLDISDKPSGVYFLVLTNQHYRQTLRLLKP